MKGFGEGAKNSIAAAATKSLQSCLTLCDPRDGSPPGSLVPGILQARTLEWVAISFSNAWKWKVKVKSLSRVGLPVTPWTVAYQAPPSMRLSRQEYWSGVPLPSPMHESEKWKWSRSVVSDSSQPHGLQPMGFARQEYWSGVPLPSPARVLVPPKSIFLIILFFLPSNTQSYSLKKIYCSWTASEHCWLGCTGHCVQGLAVNMVLVP